MSALPEEPVSDPLAIYVHWPFCARICPYCDFNVYKQQAAPALVPAIIDDLKYWRGETGPRNLSSLHFGGGTPSLMRADDVDEIINQARRLWGAQDTDKDGDKDGGKDIEIALEANPHDMDVKMWAAYAKAGVTRLSLGVQSFDEGGLKFLGRDHDSAQAQKALNLATKIFPSVSADLIFGWAGQTLVQLERDLDIITQSAAAHISTYQLTIEPDTAFAKAQSRGQARAVDDEVSAEFYERVCQRLGAAGYAHYEVSNFAKAGHRSRHNLAYWRGHDYIGVGPGAHGRLRKGREKRATVAHLRPNEYIRAVSETGCGMQQQEILSPKERAAEYVLMGLRISEGISLSHYTDLSGQTLSSSVIAEFCADGLLCQEGDRLWAQESGRLVLNKITQELLLA